MDTSRAIAVVDELMEQDRIKRSEAFKARQSYWTSIRGIFQRICPDVGERIAHNASDDSLEYLLTAEPIIEVLNYITSQVCEQTADAEISWEFIDSITEGDLRHYTFGAKPIEIKPYGCFKERFRNGITALLVIHVSERFSENDPNKSEPFIHSANLYLGGNQHMSFPLGPGIFSKIRNMASGIILAHLNKLQK